MVALATGFAFLFRLAHFLDRGDYRESDGQSYLFLLLPLLVLYACVLFISPPLFLAHSKIEAARCRCGVPQRLQLPNRFTVPPPPPAGPVAHRHEAREQQAAAFDRAQVTHCPRGKLPPSSAPKSPDTAAAAVAAPLSLAVVRSRCAPGTPPQQPPARGGPDGPRPAPEIQSVSRRLLLLRLSSTLFTRSLDQ